MLGELVELRVEGEFDLVARVGHLHDGEEVVLEPQDRGFRLVAEVVAPADFHLDFLLAAALPGQRPRHEIEEYED